MLYEFIELIIYIYINLGAKIRTLIKEKNILGGGFKSYCKTRWTTACECVESILRLELILKEESIKFKLFIYLKLINNYLIN